MRVVAIGYAWIERVDFAPNHGITIHLQVRKARHTACLYQGIPRHTAAWVEEGPEERAKTICNDSPAVAANGV